MGPHSPRHFSEVRNNWRFLVPTAPQRRWQVTFNWVSAVFCTPFFALKLPFLALAG